jgi:hypothetical protein
MAFTQIIEFRTADITAARLQVGQVRAQKTVPGRRGVRQELTGVGSAGVAAHGSAVQVQGGADLGQVQAAPKCGVDRGVAGPGLLRPQPLRCCGAGRRLRRSGLVAQAGFVPGDGPFDGVGEVVQQVPTVGDLDGERGTAGSAF